MCPKRPKTKLCTKTGFYQFFSINKRGNGGNYRVSGTQHSAYK